MPRFRSIEMRQHAPSGVLEPGAGNQSIELHEAHGYLIGDAARQLISHVELVVRRRGRAVEFLRSHGPIVQVLFQCESQRRECLVLIHVNLERVLGARATSSDGQQREDAAFQAAMLTRAMRWSACLLQFRRGAFAMRTRRISFGLAMGLGALVAFAADTAAIGYQRSIAEWRTQREAKLKAEDGWLT